MLAASSCITRTAAWADPSPPVAGAAIRSCTGSTKAARSLAWRSGNPAKPSACAARVMVDSLTPMSRDNRGAETTAPYRVSASSRSMTRRWPAVRWS